MFIDLKGNFEAKGIPAESTILVGYATRQQVQHQENVL